MCRSSSIRCAAPAFAISAKKKSAPCEIPECVTSSSAAPNAAAPASIAACSPNCSSHRDPLANLEGSSSAIRFDLDVFGLSLVEHNPGIDATGYGLVADFIRAVRE